ncbi:hypothetical protein DFH07DRAFT_952239 [Mycena maculata]|uniref:Uncharacterized protein n=1 Tax=Mycena maculata TaxID=230809 RepID=A0AAD7JYI0_9AGAR|nr:hypothetical protein DFH07DRAFT_952239 [Mycena maculata]
MTKRKLKVECGEVRDMTPQSMAAAKKAEARRQKAVLYNRRPEVLERNRIRMAEKRATVKAKRHQRDRPKPPRPSTAVSQQIGGFAEPEECMPHPLSQLGSPIASQESRSSHAESDETCSVHSAERFATVVLASIALGRECGVVNDREGYAQRTVPAPAATRAESEVSATMMQLSSVA